MFKQFIQEQHEMVTTIGRSIPERSNRIVFYTTFWATIITMPLAALWLITKPFRMIRKAF